MSPDGKAGIALRLSMERVDMGWREREGVKSVVQQWRVLDSLQGFDAHRPIT